MIDTDIIQEEITEYLRLGAELRLATIKTNLTAIAHAVELIITCLQSGGKLLFFGNGGSAADSQHLAAEFVGRFARERAALPALALTTDTSALTAIANDFGFENIFSRQVAALGCSGDIAIAISTSGNSPNVLLGVQAARQKGITTIGLTGGDGGKLVGAVDCAIVIPSTNTAHIQEMHLTIGHILCAITERELQEFPLKLNQPKDRNLKINFMSKKPLISVITPTYNCGKYINECIKSVLNQNYENFEHIIVDGASTDGTVEILKQYPHLKWISEPDEGEGEALNKALKLAQGDIIGWLNADDYYIEGVFEKVAQEMNPQKGCHVVYGNALFIDEEGKLIYEKKSASDVTLPLLLRWWEYFQHPHQPSIFYSKEVLSKVGLFNQELHFSIDYEQWIRTSLHSKFTYVDQTFSAARLRAECKSANTVPDQIKSHWRVSLPYHKYLSVGERIDFWKDYGVYTAKDTIQKTRMKIGLRTRVRNFKAWCFDS